MKRNNGYRIALFCVVMMLSFSVFSQVNMGGKKRKFKKKSGIDKRMINKKKPPSVIVAEEFDKENKHFDNPKKQAKIAAKHLEKNQKESDKKRRKQNKAILKQQKKLKPKKGKGKNTGEPKEPEL